MRIDKYLWCTRYYKTRTLATIACKKGQVRINNEVVKASREVYTLDEVTVRKNQINFKFVVNDFPGSRVSAKLVDIYRTDITPEEAFDAQDLIKYSKEYYRKKGTGRPTKKDRRDIEGFNVENEA